jgi:hypothetical protein
VAETVHNVRKQQGLAETSPMRQLSPAGYQRRHGVKDDVETGEALGARRRNLVEEMLAITVSGKCGQACHGGTLSRWLEKGRPGCHAQASREDRAILVTRAAEQMTAERQQLLDRIAVQCLEAGGLRQIALMFRAAMSSHAAAQFREWIETAKHCSFAPVDGLQQDISAVAAAVDTS